MKIAVAERNSILKLLFSVLLERYVHFSQLPLVKHYLNMIKHFQSVRAFKNKILNTVDKIEICFMVSMKLYSYR